MYKILISTLIVLSQNNGFNWVCTVLHINILAIRFKLVKVIKMLQDTLFLFCLLDISWEAMKR